MMMEQLFGVILYFIFPIFILVYTIYRYKSHSPSRNHRNPSTRSSDSIPDAKERMKLFNERKEALIKKARMMYLKKHADATKLIE